MIAEAFSYRNKLSIESMKLFKANIIKYLFLHKNKILKMFHYAKTIHWKVNTNLSRFCHRFCTTKKHNNEKLFSIHLVCAYDCKCKAHFHDIVCRWFQIFENSIILQFKRNILFPIENFSVFTSVSIYLYIS